MTRAIIIAIIAAIWVYLIGAFIAWDWGWVTEITADGRGALALVYASGVCFAVIADIALQVTADPPNQATDGKAGQK
jgi:hypothetical protein